MILYQILMCILILIAAPMCMGQLAVGGFKGKSPVTAYVYGFLLMMVSFELVTVPVLLLTSYANFKYVLMIYTPVMGLLSAGGIYRAYRTGSLNMFKTSASTFKELIKDKEQLVVWGAAAVILIVIIILTERYVIFDGDNAYYVAQSLIAQQKGTMYSTDPYTGRAAALDMRHALAVFTMWISYVGTMTRMHTTVFCHTVLAPFIIILTILIYGRIGASLLKERKELLGYFVIFIELFLIFGRVSMYTAETFLMTRTWQGKAAAANILIPAVLLTLLLIYSEYDAEAGFNRGGWWLLVLADAAAGIFSSLAVILVSVLILTGAVVAAIIKRRGRMIINSCLCCVPGGVYMLLYLYYTYFGWR